MQRSQPRTLPQSFPRTSCLLAELVWFRLARGSSFAVREADAPAGTGAASSCAKAVSRRVRSSVIAAPGGYQSLGRP